MNRVPALCLTIAAALLAAVPAAVAKKPEHAKGKGGGPPAGAQACETRSFEYDGDGAPGTGSVNDPLFSKQWGLDQVNAPEAWARGATGAGAVVAVVDTGVDLEHPDLQANLVPGVDIVEQKDDCPAGPQDEHGHGTHVAGIAAAVTDNGAGVAGTAPDASIMPVRVLDEEGSGTIEDVVAGIRYAADHGADVINLSLGELPIVGQSKTLNQDVEEAVSYAFARGAAVVGAAGNETFPLCSYPAAAEKAICVGATDRRELPSFYSNLPNDDDAVGVRAPGGLGSVFCEHSEDVWSTIWPGSELDCQGSGSLSGYDTLAGTSMAAPHVSGVAALLAAQGLTNEQIYRRIRETSSNDGSYDPVYGYGIVDADAATAG